MSWGAKGYAGKPALWRMIVSMGMIIAVCAVAIVCAVSVTRMMTTED